MLVFYCGSGCIAFRDYNERKKIECQINQAVEKQNKKVDNQAHSDQNILAQPGHFVIRDPQDSQYLPGQQVHIPVPTHHQHQVYDSQRNYSADKSMDNEEEDDRLFSSVNYH